jgi:hypothetical protein
VTTVGDVVVDGFGEADRPRDATSGVDAHVQLRYASPEQLSARTRAPAMDMFTVGALLHELLDGRAFRGETSEPVKLLALARSGEVGALGVPAPAELEAVRVRLLAREPAARPSAAAAREMLAKPLGDRETGRAALGRVCAELRAPPSSARDDEPEPLVPSAARSPVPIEEGTVALDDEVLARMRGASARVTTPVVTPPVKTPREPAVRVVAEIGPAAVVEPTEFVVPPGRVVEAPRAAAPTPSRARERPDAREPDPEGTAFHVAAPARSVTMLLVGAVAAIVLGVLVAVLLVD